MIYQNIFELIGNTPLLNLTKTKKKLNLYGNIIVKLEKNNLTSSIKDRVAKEIILAGLKNNTINNDSVIILATSGNMGISFAALCCYLDLSLIITMPENMSKERKKIIESLGAEVVETPFKLGMKGAIDEAIELVKKTSNAILIDQFTNLNNPSSHYKTTGKEIFEDTMGRVDVVVAGIGSGGTISGVGKYLKEQNKKIKIIGVEPFSSSVITTGEKGLHNIQGIGAGFIPNTLDLNYVDQVMRITDEEALFFQSYIQKTEGILMGISSGAVLCAAIKLSTSADMRDKNIVVILPDSKERYLL